MKKYYLLVQGTNCWLPDETGSPVRFAFLQNHWIEAPDEATAKDLAIASARNDPRWGVTDLSSQARSIRFRVKEARAVESFEGIGANPSGLNFYRSPRWWEFWERAWWLNLSPW